VVAAIILWNTKYLQVAYAEQRRHGGTINEDLLRHVAPLGWEHIGLTGDYVWSTADQPPVRSDRCGNRLSPETRKNGFSKLRSRTSPSRQK
jgi:hypothetical protein